MANTLTISAVARRAGLRTSAIRYYESVGLLPTPGRVSGHRRYDPDVLPRLALIAAAQQMGFTIAEIGALMHGFEADTPAAIRWQSLAARKLIEVEALIARAEAMKQLLGEALRCECLTLDACARAFQARGCSAEDQEC
ncbi:MAG TPA: MerR family transcriptional regulator [Chloroflexota bacterium]|nr:MerR family transcriptional regulator [Chloroflexota bacterium]